MRRRLVIAVIVVVVIGVVTPVTWTLLGWPPPRLILKYGLTPGCEPTGETMNVYGIEFVEIGPGCFRMGSHFECEEGDLLGRMSAIVGLDWGKPPRHDSRECPPHWVEFPRGFWIARTEVTNEQYERFDPEHERFETTPGDRHPVVVVSWEEAREYCVWLSGKSGLDIRLPSEAMWEAACRAGSESEFCFGDGEDRIGEYAWFDVEIWRGGAHEVGTRRGNGWGLFDLHGNVREWCEDTYHESYEDAPSDGSAWTEGGEVWQGIPKRVIRGGGWYDPAVVCRSAFRFSNIPIHPKWGLGFRPCIWPSVD